MDLIIIRYKQEMQITFCNVIYKFPDEGPLLETSKSCLSPR